MHTITFTAALELVEYTHFDAHIFFFAPMFGRNESKSELPFSHWSADFRATGYQVTF